MSVAPVRTPVPVRTRRLALAASTVGAALVALDGTALLVAQPSLRRDLHASLAAVSWTSTGYLTTVAALLVLAGRLADRYGHRRLFATGVTGFAVASAGLVVAPSIGWVVALRVAQGVFGALLQPATLGLLRVTWPPDRIGTAVAVRTSVIGIASASGPVLGGLVVATWGWRAVFLLSAGPALVAAVLARGLAPGSVPATDGSASRTGGARRTYGRRSPGLGRRGRPPGPCAVAARVSAGVRGYRAATAHGPGRCAVAARVPAGVRSYRAATAPRTGARPDVAGAVLLALSLGTAVHTLVGVPQAGWTSSRTLLGVAVTGAATVALVVRERRAAAPLVPRAVLASPLVRPAVALLVLTTAALFGTVFTLTYALQDGAGVGPLGAGLRVLPLTAAMVGGAPLAGLTLRRFGARWTAFAGVALVGVALVVLAVAGVPGLAAEACFVLLGAGFAAVMVTGTGAVVGDAPPAYAGVAGGLKQTAMNVGPTTGIAIAATALDVSGSGRGSGAVLLVLAALALPAAVAAARLPGGRPAVWWGREVSDYDAFAEGYERHAVDSPYNAYYDRPAVLALLGDVAGRTVLDAGCGPGLYAEELLARGARVTGCDQSREMVRLAHRVLVPAGRVVVSTVHPTFDWRNVGGSYFTVEDRVETWQGGWRATVRRAPLEYWCGAFADAGFAVERIVEPRPVAAMAERHPHVYERLTTEPGFIAFRLVKAPTGR